MKIEDYMLYMVECYINNEIEYIQSQVDTRDMELHREDYKKDLEYLQSLTIDDLNEITRLCFDDDIQQKLYDNINYYLYHYKYEKEGKE